MMEEKQLRADIRTHYENWLAARGFKARPGQLRMIDAVADTLLAAWGEEASDAEGAGIAAIEAPTGTGKTIAYLAAALPIARALGKKLVVSASTVMLQEQLVRKDLPELRRDGGLKFDFALAKGRARYLCRLRLGQLLESGAADAGQAALYPDEILPQEEELGLYRRMAGALDAGRWHGDRDAWDGALQPQTWRRLTASRNQCSGRKCRSYSRCCFYAARQDMRDADCIVANHDLVLTDLFLGDGTLLPPLEDSIYIFDEAHRLSDRALQRFARRTRLGGGESRLEKCRKQLQKIAAALETHNVLPKLWDGRDALLDALEERLGEIETLLRALLQQNAQQSQAAAGRSLRFSGGATPEELRCLAEQVRALYAELEQMLQRAQHKLDDLLQDVADELRGVAELWLPAVGELQREIEEERILWAGYAREDAVNAAPCARWLNLDDDSGRLTVSVSPVQVADVLRDELWGRCRSAVLCSATLRALGSFDRFVDQVGLPPAASLHELPQVFDHAKAAELVVPDLGCTPKEPARHTKAVANYLGKALRERGGSLALFASRRQMQDVHEMLPAALRRRVLLQRQDRSVAELVEMHKRRVDETGRSALFGLASLAEGLDLPGAYCTQLIIAKFFFAPPDDPVVKTFEEWLRSRGGNPFAEISMPDASLRLVQACGRLLRSEQDTGKIILLDSRAVTMSYGRALLESLPPFPVRNELRR